MNMIDFLYASRLYKTAGPLYSGIGHILMFHRVSREKDHCITKGLTVSPEYLENTIRHFLSKDYEIITLDALQLYFSGKAKSKRFVVFTFDDGYADNLTHALPVFEKYNSPFTLYLITDYPDHKAVMWWYLLEDLVLKRDTIEFSHENQKYLYRTITMEEKRLTFRKIRRFILQSNRQNLRERLESVFHAYNYDLFTLTKKLALSWDQVIALSNHPLVTIGAHTMSHIALNQLTDQEIKEEIEGSVRIIENKTQKTVSHFSYPFGSVNEVGTREMEIAATCSIKTGTTTRSGNIFKAHCHHLHALPRIDMREGFTEKKLDLYIEGFTPCLKNNFRRIITV